MSVEVDQNVTAPVSRKKWHYYFFPKLPYGFQGFSFWWEEHEMFIYIEH